MRSVVEVITTRTPTACSRRATAKPIPSALPAPVITAVCLFNGRITKLSAEGIIHGSGKIAIRVSWRGFSRQQNEVAERTVGELARPSRGMVVADASEAYAFSVVRSGFSCVSTDENFAGGHHDATGSP